MSVDPKPIPPFKRKRTPVLIESESLTEDEVSTLRTALRWYAEDRDNCAKAERHTAITSDHIQARNEATALLIKLYGCFSATIIRHK